VTGIAPVLPSPAAVRRAARRYRRQHLPGQLAERAGDLYMIALAVAGIVITIVTSVHRTPTGEVSSVPRLSGDGTTALATAFTLVVAGAGLLALTAVGPLFAGAAAQTWQLSTPGSRGRWLLPRLSWLVSGTAAAGATAGMAAALALNAELAGLGLATLAGAALAAALALAAVTRQVRPGAATRQAARTLIAVGVLVAVFALYVARPGVHLDLRLGGLPTAVLGLVAVVLMLVVAAVGAVRALPRIDRAALSAGAGLAGSAAVAVAGMDPSLLFGAVEIQRLQRIGRVRPGPLRAWGRPSALIRADVRRLRRNPTALLTWGTLALVPYLADLVAPVQAATAVRVVAGYIAGNALAGGLRTVCRTPALRRALGGTDANLRILHLVVPAVGVLAWIAATFGAGRTFGPIATVVLAAGLLASVYRTATRPPMEYDAAWSVTPMGVIPVGLITQALRGPDLAVVLAVVLGYAL
jgi:hypothetical protein